MDRAWPCSRRHVEKVISSTPSTLVDFCLFLYGRNITPTPFNIKSRHHPRPLLYIYFISFPALLTSNFYLLYLLHRRKDPLLMINPSVPLLLLLPLLFLLCLSPCLVLNQTAKAVKQRRKLLPNRTYAFSPWPWSYERIYTRMSYSMALPRSLICSLSTVSSLAKSNLFYINHP